MSNSSTQNPNVVAAAQPSRTPNPSSRQPAEIPVKDIMFTAVHFDRHDNDSFMHALGEPGEGGDLPNPASVSGRQRTANRWRHWRSQPCCGGRRGCTKGHACCVAATVFGLALFLGMGILAGTSIGWKKAQAAVAAAPPPYNATAEFMSRLNAAETAALRGDYKQIPQPGSPEAEALLSNNQATGVDARLQKLLRQTNDNAVLNRTVVESWLQRIADVAQRADLPNFDPEPFIGVANLVVSLLWTLRADSLLTLLRDYAATGKFDITAVDQDALVREVQTVLQEPTLELFSRRNIVKENEGGPANPWLELSSVLANTSGEPLASTSPPGSSSNSEGATDTSNRRRRLSAAGGTTTKQTSPRGSAQASSYQSREGPGVGARLSLPSRRLLQGTPGVTLPGLSNNSTTNSTTNSTSRVNGMVGPLQGSQIPEAARGPTEQEASLNAFLATIPGADNAPVPVITPQQAVANATLATAAPLQTLDSMLCAARRFMNDSVDLLPAAEAAAGARPGSGAGGAPARPIANSTGSAELQQALAGCSPPPGSVFFMYQDLVFRPVVLPVVIHGLRFVDTGGYLHPNYGPADDLSFREAAAEHLINRTNRLLNGTGIQLQLQELRTDPKQYPYLLVPGGLQGWQACTASTAAGIACVSALMRDNAAQGYVLNVVLSGSQANADYCNVQDPNDPCGSLALGLSGAAGPWMPTPNAAWSEDNTALNWVFMLWDFISPDFRNSDEQWNGGAVTLAHETGHYLGLRHTHQGGCAGDGFLPQSDEVPDTPENRDINVIYDDRQYNRLDAWCQRYRFGLTPVLDVLRNYRSCGGEQAASPDNLFNLMSYLPDACSMIFTENQKARLQWAVASFRPRMLTTFAATT